MVIQIWDSKHYNLIVMALYTAYAVGAAPAAEMAYFFEAGVFESLGLHQNGHHNMTTHENGHHTTHLASNGDGSDNSTTKVESVLDFIPKPMYPFDIAALLCFLGGALFLVLFGSSMIALPKIPKAVKDTIWAARKENMKPPRWFLSKVKLGPRIVFCLLSFFFLPLAMEISFGRFLFIYAEETSLNYDREWSTYLQMLFWGGVILGRLLTPLAARCITPNGLAITCLTTSIISTAVLFAYGEKFPVFFWIFSAVTGVFIGPVVPLGLTWCNVNLNRSAMGVAVAFTIMGAGDALFSWVVGFILDIYGPQALVLYALATLGLGFIFYLPVIPLLAKKKKFRLKRKKVVD